MNIWTLPGKKIVFQPDQTYLGGKLHNGWDYDRNHAFGILEVGKEYTVSKTKVGGWNTKVILEEFPKEVFNSVLFINSETQSEEEDMKHSDWSLYNKE